MSTQVSSAPAKPAPSVSKIDERLEVVRIGVTDVDRAKRFYEGLGWRLDADFAIDEDHRIVQLTPPGSDCSIQFGKGLTKAAPGSAQGLVLVVYDIDAARAELVARGAKVSEVFHLDATKGRVAGPDPQRQSYGSWAELADPDGNGWLLQEVRTRLPGRVGKGPALLMDVATLTALLVETEQHHGVYEAKAPKHAWPGWYAAYIVAREHGRTPDEAASDAALHVKGTRS